jgi:hypothetical protein
LTYQDSIAVRVIITAAERARDGERRFAETLRYQACDARRCLFPADTDLTFTVSLERRD